MGGGVLGVSCSFLLVTCRLLIFFFMPKLFDYEAKGEG